MGVYRQIHTKIWKDGWFLDLEPDLKLLFIYLFSNDRANLAGLYDIPLKVISFETDLPTERIQDGLEAFMREGKAFYEGGWLWIPNLLRYNAQNITSIKIQTHLKTALAEIPEIPLKHRWIEHYNGIVAPEYRMDTVSIPDLQEQEQEQEQEQDQEQELSPTGDAAASTPGNGPVNFEDWLALIEKPPKGSNRTAQLVRMHTTLFPGRDPPDFGYAGKVAKSVGGAGRLANLLWQASAQRITGDPLRYAIGIHKGEKDRDDLPGQNVQELGAYQ